MSENAAVEELFEKWRRLQPLDPAAERRLWLKLRLEWNYNSNHIEGNTLTYGETKLLLIHGKTRGEHDLREYEEMKAHDVAIDYVREMVRQKHEMTEGEIRNLNQIILKEPFWKEAITPDGEPTRIQIVPGQYKTRHNNVRTATGEIFEYADPLDVRPRMRDLVTWLQKILDEKPADPVILAAKLHHDFVLIHPFADGNGRVARLLVNYLFLRLGYPPIIVKSARKSAYLDALRRADAGDLEPLNNVFREELIWSLELGLKAATGEDLEEVTDIDRDRGSANLKQRRDSC